MRQQVDNGMTEFETTHLRAGRLQLRLSGYAGAFFTGPSFRNKVGTGHYPDPLMVLVSPGG